MRVRDLGNRPAPSTIREFISRMLPRGQRPSIKVQRQQISYWQQQGWRQNGNQFLGNYQTSYGAFHGSIEQRGGSHFRFFIFNPPPELQRHSHWSCFIDRGSNWYEVHMGRKPADVSSGIMTIERLLKEAF